MALTLEEANRMIQAATAKADATNIKVSVAVCDASGRLMAFNRMDGAAWLSIYGAQGKAVACSSMGIPTAQLIELAMSPFFAVLQSMEGGHMLPAQGGVPVYRDGELIGAVGAGGGSAQQDEDCSQAGADAL